MSCKCVSHIYLNKIAKPKIFISNCFLLKKLSKVFFSNKVKLLYFFTQEDEYN